MDADHFLRVSPPHLHLWLGDASQIRDEALSLARTSKKHAAVRVVRGAKARTGEAFFNELGAALQLPAYFGENWNALNDCLNDLEWLPGDAYLLVFTNSDQLLDREPGDQLATLMNLLEKAAEGWAHPESSGLNRSARPFHVVFQCSKDRESHFRSRIRGLHSILHPVT